MYTQYFNLAELPFSIAPNPRYLYLSAQHREALAHLLYGIGVGGGFIVLSGEVGMGKTTLCRALLDQLPDDVEIALIFNPRLNSRELLASICDELQISYPGSRASLKQLIDALNAHLLAAHAKGRRVIILIDEAQNLRFDVLEQVRLLTNLETDQTKLLQIILVGQPELNQLLDRPNLRQLSQRITARYHLEPLQLEATGEYVRHRLKVAGGREDLFSRSGIREIQKRSAGIPRLINLIGDRALLGAYTLGRRRVDGKIVRRAALELKGGTGRSRRPPRNNRYNWILGSLILVSVLWGGWMIKGPWDVPSLKEMGDSLGVREWMPILPKASQPATEAQVPPRPESDSKLPLLNRADALNLLFLLWDDHPGAEGACKGSGDRGLKCQNYRGSLERLIRLNVPALLEISDENASSGYLLIERLNEDRAWIRTQEGPLEVSVASIQSRWNGRAILAYRLDLMDRKTLRPGALSPLVPWIRKQLGVEVPHAHVDVNRYDEELRTKVRQFQMAMGLRADGLIGTLTVIGLQGNGLDAGVPRLRLKPE